MAEYTCSICETKFDEEEKNLTNDESKCILHCEKNETIDCEILFNKKLILYTGFTQANNMLKFIGIHFPYNYDNNQLKEYSKKTFVGCTFNDKLIHTGQSNIFKECLFNKYGLSYSSKGTIENLLFENCKFNEVYFHNIIFTKEIFKFTEANKFYDIEKFILTDCEVKEDFLIVSLNDKEKKFKINEINLEHSVFHKKVKIQFCDIGEGSFYNTKFKDLADFYQSKFNKVNFERTDFEGITVFSEVEFNCDVFFKYTKFLSSTIFRDTVIHENLDLRDSIFGNEADAIFLDITSKSRKVIVDDKTKFIGEPKDIKVSNRETARLIKSFYDYSNNIIEANRFYKLEMIEKEKELNITKRKYIFEWVVFKIHGMTSNHSQDWLLVLFWIINIGLIASIFNFYTMQDEKFNYVHASFENIVITMMLILTTIFTAFCLTYRNKMMYTMSMIGFYLIYWFISHDMFLTQFANVINPFSIMTKGDTLNLGMLIFKVIIAYLIYQFVVAIRQNTRRK